MSKSTETKLVATRVSMETCRILQIGLLLEDAETMQDLLRPVVDDYARQLEREPAVKAMIKEIEGHQAKKRGVRALPSSRRRQS